MFDRHAIQTPRPCACDRPARGEVAWQVAVLPVVTAIAVADANLSLALELVGIAIALLVAVEVMEMNDRRRRSAPSAASGSEVGAESNPSACRASAETRVNRLAGAYRASGPAAFTCDERDAMDRLISADLPMLMSLHQSAVATAVATEVERERADQLLSKGLVGIERTLRRHLGPQVSIALARLEAKALELTRQTATGLPHPGRTSAGIGGPPRPDAPAVDSGTLGGMR